MKRLVCLCLTLLLTANLLTGCQSSTNNSLQKENAGISPSSPADWTVGFRTGPQQEGDDLYVVDYLSLEHKVPEDMDWRYSPSCKAVGDSFFALYRYDVQEGERTFLEKHSLETSEPEQTIELDPAGWGVPDAFIVSYDLTEDGYVFLVKAGNDAEADNAADQGLCWIVYTDLQGDLVSQLDLTDILKGQGLLETAQKNQTVLHRDGDGYLYMVMNLNSLLIVLDQAGNVVTQYDCSANDHNQIQGPVRDNSGRLIFPVSLVDDRTTRFLGRVERNMKELAVFEELIDGKWFGMYDSCLYYEDVTDSVLIRWNVETGLREKVMDMDALGVTIGQGLCMLLKGERDIRLRVLSPLQSVSEDFLVTLSEQAPEYDSAVQMVVFNKVNDGKFLQSTMARFNRSNPQYTFTMETDGEDKEVQETFRTRVMADIMSGGGPDILCVSFEDMEILSDAGALVPIEELVSKETLGDLLPTVLQAGTCEGKIMGIPPTIEVRTLSTSKSIWSGDSWTLDDILTLAEEKEGLEGLLTYGIVDTPEYNTLLSFVGMGIHKSRFLDMENRKSRFEQENFMRVLEVIKRYAPKGNNSDINGIRRIREETHLALIEFISDPLTFSLALNGAGYEGNHVGFPTESGGGNYVMANGFLVVNAKSENLEAVSAFLEELLSFETQARLTVFEGLSVRSNMADRLIEYDEESGYIWNSTGSMLIMQTMEDPTEGFNAFLQRCEPYDYNNKIFDIIWEESQAYFFGDKDALTVTRAIDNRVQLYLDEQ